MTDHDNCDGYSATVGSCRRVLRGLELTCADRGRTVHILLYDVTNDDDRWAELEQCLQEMRQARIERLRAIAGRLEELGVTIDIESIVEAAGGRSLGRPDVARALVQEGVVASLDEAYRRFLGDNAAANVRLEQLSVAQGLEIGLRAGAKMALAHPHTLGDRVPELMRRYRSAGLEGLECYYGMYASKQRRRWLQLAKKLDLVVTGGSDFHGEPTPQIAEPGITLPEPHSERLCEWLGL